jgi:uroporphyrin-III C-methyltransferase / precorrin-2 dehydrogenase / sirohydrochlorin ferrochelatase
MALFPAFLKLAGRKVVVVGAGPVAASKIEGLLTAGARVTVVAPDVVSAIESAPVEIERRAFEPNDLDGAWFVVAAAPPIVNQAVRDAAEARQLFVNAVDDPPNATAYLGGIVRKHGVTVAISTDGCAPALAGLLREGLETLLPDDLEAWLDVSRRERETWKRLGVPMEDRRPLLLEAINRLYDARRVGAHRLPPHNVSRRDLDLAQSAKSGLRSSEEEVTA